MIDKPAGLLSVPGKGADKQDCVASRVREMFPKGDGPLIVHRLDMDTSGLLVLGLTRASQAALSVQFERREIEKAYVAIVDTLGDARIADEGEVDLPIRTDVDDRPRQIVDFVHGKASRTRYRVLGREADRARLHLEPLTGRTHQLRVHCASPARMSNARGEPVAGGLGAPILGDPLYGRHEGRDATRLMLHAQLLAFRHPALGRWMEFRSEMRA